jgi:hypothetical protein
MSAFTSFTSDPIDSVGAGAPNFTRNAVIAATALTAGTVGAWCVVAPAVSQTVNVLAAGVLLQAASTKLKLNSSHS